MNEELEYLKSVRFEKYLKKINNKKMVLFMFIGIWLFIVALKAYHQLKYKNFILEKIYHLFEI